MSIRMLKMNILTLNFLIILIFVINNFHNCQYIKTTASLPKYVKYIKNTYNINLKSNILIEKNIICYYESKSNFRQGQAKFEISYIEPALQHCTHLIYGYAAINKENYKLIPLNEHYDVIKDNYRKVTNLKQKFPKLKILLSVGGNNDINEDSNNINLKYRTLLEYSNHRLTFINSAYTLIKAFGFDGLDLAWQFPSTKPKKIRSTLGSLWHSLKKKVGATGEVDDKSNEHREQFTSFVREIRNVFQTDNLLISLTVLPNINSTIYYEPRAISAYVDFINILAFDFHTPERNPKEADYPAPLYEIIDRRPDENVDAQIKYWLNNGAPASKLILGIPTYGRAWKMDDESDINGMPPLHIDGPAEPGLYTKDAGLLSYTEICLLLNEGQNVKGSTATTTLQIKRITDMKKGTFAFKLADENNNGGIWIGYDDLEAIKNKISYIKAKELGGVAIKDLTLDDFKGLCENVKFPILKTAISSL